MFLGNISYPVYLLHGPLGRLFIGQAPGIGTGAAFIAIVMLAAWLAYRFGEKPLGSKLLRL
jgi:peptidoglycan/LPS O-acetylase OafA/YrhL